MGKAGHRIEALRGAVHDAVVENGPRLSVAQAATLATMPGAQALSSPSTQAALRGAAAVARYPAAQAGLAVGIAGTIAAGALLEAKYGYVEVFDYADAGKAWVQNGVIDGLADQAGRQAAITAQSHPVEWHVSESSVVPKMQDQQIRGSEGAPNMTVVHTPAIGVAR